MLRFELVGGHDVAIDVEAHRRASVAGAFGELARRDTALMPEGDPAVAQVVRVVVRHLGEFAGAQHRLIGARFGHALEHAAVGDAILERARLLDRLHEPLGEIDPTRGVALRRRAGKAQAQAGRVDVAPLEVDGFASEALKAEIRERHAAGETIPELAQKLGMPFGTVKMIAARQTERKREQRAREREAAELRLF